MGVEFPDYLRICCDKCGATSEMHVTVFKVTESGVCGISVNTLEYHNWGYDSDGVYCPKCMKEFREKEGS